MILLAVCLSVLVAFGLAERAAIRHARRLLPIRVHVNGTRGKSTVTRLVAAALREAGIPTVAKVTGTAPRLILPDGSERAIRRWAPANIREQAWLLRRARRAGAHAVVAECMALRPDLQWASEHDVVRAKVGVITNVRLDHTDVMGHSLEEVAVSLAATTPRDGVLVLGDARVQPAIAARCAEMHTKLVLATRPGRASEGTPSESVTSDEMTPGVVSWPLGVAARPAWLAEDICTALAVTRELRIDDEVALRGMEKAAADPGSATTGVSTIAGQAVAWIDATAANDPESLDLVVGGTVSAQGSSPVLAVYNHRADRPERLRTFAAHSEVLRQSAALVITGDRPPLSVMRLIRRECAARVIRVVRRRRLSVAIAAIVGGERTSAFAPGATADKSDFKYLVIFCGNTRGHRAGSGPGVQHVDET